MKITRALQFIKYNIKSEQNGVKGIKTTTLAGKPGIGKTERTRELARELNLNFYHVSAPELSTEQLSGIPEFENVPEGFERYSVSHTTNPKGTTWSCPEIIATANRKANTTLEDTDNNKILVDGKEQEVEGCLLLLDDLHETPQSTITYLYQLLNEKKVSGWALDKKVYIVTAMNDSESANWEGLPSPIINRMQILKVEFDSQEFLDTYSVNFNYIVRSFLKRNKHFLNEEESTEAPFGTPRSWTQANNSFDYIYSVDKNEAIEFIGDYFEGSVSDKAALELQKMAEYMVKLDLEGYVKDGVEKMKEGGKLDINFKQVDKELDNLGKVLLGYVVNFIDTPEHGCFLAKLLDDNLEHRSFIGFCISEVYLKYMVQVKQNRPVSEGLRLFLEKALGIGKFDISTYNVDKKTKKMIEEVELKNKKEILNISQQYIC